MGLDMFLYSKRFFWHDEDALKQAVASAVPNAPGEPNELRVEVMYWRKANHIHQWFVEHVQDGVDNCGTYYVSKKKLVELVNLCKKVLAERQLASTALPTQGGFFFGSTAYDESYFQDCQETIKKLSPVVKQFDRFKNWTFEYHSSW